MLCFRTMDHPPTCVWHFATTHYTCECRSGINYGEFCETPVTCGFDQCDTNCPKWSDWGSCKDGYSLRYRSCPCDHQDSEFHPDNIWLSNATCFHRKTCSFVEDNSGIIIAISLSVLLALLILTCVLLIIKMRKSKRARGDIHDLPTVYPEPPTQEHRSPEPPLAASPGYGFTNFAYASAGSDIFPPLSPVQLPGGSPQISRI